MKEKGEITINFLFTCLMGLGLALPNIICQLIRRCQNKITASANTLIMNILLNFSYGNILGYFLKIGDELSLQVGIIVISIYGILCLINACVQCGGGSSYFDVITKLCRKMDTSITLPDSLSENRKLPPTIIAGCYAQHKESREVYTDYEEYQEAVYETKTITKNDGTTETVREFSHYETRERVKDHHYSEWDRVDNGGGHFTYNPCCHSASRSEKTVEYKTVKVWERETEYQYVSWQDDTNSLSNVPYFPIIEVSFNHMINLDESARTRLSSIKNSLYNEGLRHDTDVHTYEKFTVPNFKDKIKCILNENEYQRIQKRFSNGCGYAVWIILFILGYSTIFESFARYESGKVKVRIIKNVSDSNDKRATYRNLDQFLNPITISYVRTKIQAKAIEEKLKKGKFDDFDSEIPMMIVY